MERDRPLFLKVGFVAALSMVILAFNYTVTPVDRSYSGEVETLVDDEINVVRTGTPKPPAPPPTPTPSPDPEPIEPITPEPIPPIEPIMPGPPDPLPEPVIGHPEPIVAPPPLPKDPVVDDEPILLPEKMPLFPGCMDASMSIAEREQCSNDALIKFLGANVSYPDLARDVGVEGTVVIQFVIEKDGQISGAKIVRDIGAGCGSEALRVVNEMPAWTPGKQQGMPVRVLFNLPVRFRLTK